MERYDLLGLPPKLPYGGMENPGTEPFAGLHDPRRDKQLVSLGAHELAHSGRAPGHQCHMERLWLQ